jgi:hypothetical protein
MRKAGAHLPTEVLTAVKPGASSDAATTSAPPANAPAFPRWAVLVAVLALVGAALVGAFFAGAFAPRATTTNAPRAVR